MPDKNYPPESFPDEAVLLAYLEGKADPAEAAAIEAALDQSDFLRDALEGLSQAGDGAAIRASKQKLQARLQEQLTPRRKALSPGQVLWKENWIWLSLVLVLVLGIVAYWIIRHLLVPS